METATRSVAATTEAIVGSHDDRSGRLQRVLRRASDSLYRFILVRVGGKRDVADDLLQQTCCVAVGHRGLPKTDEACLAWLHGVARNVLRRHWRHKGKLTEATVEHSGASRKLVESMETESMPVDELIRDETVTLLLGAISSLSEPNQQLIFDYYFDGRSQADIAGELGVPVKGVEAKLYRLRSQLREVLRGQERTSV